MGKQCAIIILLYKAVNNEDEHNNTIKSHSIEYRELFNGYGPIRFQHHSSIIIIIISQLMEICLLQIHVCTCS